MPHHRQRSTGNGRVVHLRAPRRKVVLVLEDHASVGGLIAGLVRQDGYRTVRAWDQREAVRLARGRAPDLILLDLSLAYPDGLGMLDHMIHEGVVKATPVVVVAAHPVNLSAEQASAVREIVQKPFDIDAMLNAVRRSLGDPEVELAPRLYEAQDHFLHGY